MVSFHSFLKSQNKTSILRPLVLNRGNFITSDDLDNRLLNITVVILKGN